MSNVNAKKVLHEISSTGVTETILTVSAGKTIEILSIVLLTTGTTEVQLFFDISSTERKFYHNTGLAANTPTMIDMNMTLTEADILKVQSDNLNLITYVSYLESDDTGAITREVISHSGTSDTATLYTVPAGKSATIKNFIMHDDDATVSISTAVLYVDEGGGNKRIFYNDMNEYDTIFVDTPIVLEAGDILKGVSASSSINAFISYYEKDE